MSASSAGTANCGVPQKTSFIVGSLGALPLASLLQFANAALNEVALQGADSEDEQDAVEVIDLVLKSPCQQLLSIVVAPLAIERLGTDLDDRCARDLLVDVWQAEAAFF